MTKGKKVGPNDAHGGVRHKKEINQARSGSKKPVCRIYALGVRRVAHRGRAGPTSLCSVLNLEFLVTPLKICLPQRHPVKKSLHQQQGACKC
jgi:hypothetical protein